MSKSPNLGSTTLKDADFTGHLLFGFQNTLDDESNISTIYAPLLDFADLKGTDFRRIRCFEILSTSPDASVISPQFKEVNDSCGFATIEDIPFTLETYQLQLDSNFRTNLISFKKDFCDIFIPFKETNWNEAMLPNVFYQFFKKIAPIAEEKLFDNLENDELLEYIKDKFSSSETKRIRESVHPYD